VHKHPHIEKVELGISDKLSQYAKVTDVLIAAYQKGSEKRNEIEWRLMEALARDVEKERKTKEK
jgi:hypothetical protein